MEASEIIIKTLQKAGKPMKSGEIAELTGMDKAEVDKVIKKLKKEEKIQSPKNCYYQLK
jgi:Mn-dependent DtxR family transcriptional regulator